MPGPQSPAYPRSRAQSVLRGSRGGRRTALRGAIVGARYPPAAVAGRGVTRAIASAGIAAGRSRIASHICLGTESSYRACRPERLGSPHSTARRHDRCTASTNCRRPTRQDTSNRAHRAAARGRRFFIPSASSAARVKPSTVDEVVIASALVGDGSANALGAWQRAKRRVAAAAAERHRTHRKLVANFINGGRKTVRIQMRKVQNAGLATHTSQPYLSPDYTPVSQFTALSLARQHAQDRQIESC